MPPENFHVTLKFLGGVDAAQVPILTDVLRAATAGYRAFDLEIGGLGAFPSVTRPRVLWAGVIEGGHPLGALAAGVEHMLAGFGFEPEARGFSPHITLGRVRESTRAPFIGVPRTAGPLPRDALRGATSALAAALTGAARRRFGRVSIDRVTLMRSDLSPRGARYTELASVPLPR